MTTITPIENGLHSLAKGLEAFEKLHSDHSDVFALKDAVLRTHHAVETLTKAILFEINPVLVLKNDTKIGKFVSRFEEFAQGKNSFIIDEEFTIGLVDALDRLRGLGELRQYPDREFYQLRSSTVELETYRNAIQHFAVNGNVETVSRVLGNAVPRFVDLLGVLSRSIRRPLGLGYSLAHFSHPNMDLTGFRRRLDEIYSESGKVLDLLRSRYDDLLRKAYEFFLGREFHETAISAKVRDHGKVGAPPYMPEIVLSGAVELDINTHQLMFQGFPMRSSDDGPLVNIEAYEGSVSISDPVKLGPVEQETYTPVSGSIELRARIALSRADPVIRLSGADQFVAVLRDIDINLSALLDYHALAIYNQAHYDVQRIQSASGALELMMTAVPAGYDVEGKEHLVAGTYRCDLNQKNAPFKLHAFVEPDESLSDNHIFDWSINTKSVLEFAN